jgi:hypothetical protein
MSSPHAAETTLRPPGPAAPADARWSVSSSRAMKARLKACTAPPSWCVSRPGAAPARSHLDVDFVLSEQHVLPALVPGRTAPTRAAGECVRGTAGAEAGQRG